MRKLSVFICIILVFMVQVSLFAAGNRETPVQHNVYAHLGVPYTGFGYEGAVGNNISLGAAFGFSPEYDVSGIFFTPRVYFGSALEGFNLGANLGLIFYYDDIDDIAIGANAGYKFVFGNGSSGFSLEPTIGVDYFTEYGEIIPNIGVRLGYAFGGRTGSAPDPRPAAQPTTGSGLYIGIIGFNDRLMIFPIESLDARNMHRAIQFIDNLSMRPSTGLYYAVDQGIDMLERARLPNDLASVSIVTFTDGLDNASIDLNSRFARRDEYRDFLAARIARTSFRSRQRGDLPLNAHVVGIRGGDVADVAAYEAGLRALVSDQRNLYSSPNPRDFSGVNQRFNQIANQLYNESTRQSVRLRITGGYDDGTRIRFTFDNVTDASRSNQYIEGTYRRSGTVRSLENVRYQGLRSSSGSTVSGAISENVFVHFSFAETSTASGAILNLGNAQQWEFRDSLNSWQRNSEFNPAQDTHVSVDRTSAIIMLVLDCTTSLDAGDVRMFELMKGAAKDFIRVLVSGTR